MPNRLRAPDIGLKTARCALRRLLSRAAIVLRPNQESVMPKFVIEREIPGAGKLPPQELHAIAQKSCSVLQAMGPQIQWLHSFVTDHKVYCVYIAPDEATVRAHARQGGFPANSVARVHVVIDPLTAEPLAA